MVRSSPGRGKENNDVSDGGEGGFGRGAGGREQEERDRETNDRRIIGNLFPAEITLSVGRFPQPLLEARPPDPMVGRGGFDADLFRRQLADQPRGYAIVPREILATRSTFPPG